MTIRPLFGFIESPEWLELCRLTDRLWPGQFGRLRCAEGRAWLNEKTGIKVENGPVLGCVRQWLPRLREMAAEKERAA